MEPAADPVARFTSLIRDERGEPELDILTALLGEAFDRRASAADVIDRLDQLASGTPATFEAIMNRLFASGELRGNHADYGDPRNSFLHDVLTRGLGLPITLSVVAIEVGRRLDVPIVGIGLPGHFMVADAGSDRFADPFHAGRIYPADEVLGAWRAVTGSTGTLQPSMLAATPPRAIVVRMLNNLRHTFEQRGDELRLAVLASLRAAFPELATERSQHARWLRRMN